MKRITLGAFVQRPLKKKDSEPSHLFGCMLSNEFLEDSRKSFVALHAHHGLHKQTRESVFSIAHVQLKKLFQNNLRSTLFFWDHIVFEQ